MIRVLRHAEAGTRTYREGPDEERPLTAEGRMQAEAIAAGMPPGGVQRILTSPYARCRQSVEPLAELTGVPLENEALLAEGTPAGVVEMLLATLEPGTVLCTHGDVAAGLISGLMATGSDAGHCAYPDKGSIWELEVGPDGQIRPGRYLPPPDLSGSRSTGS